MGSTIAFANQKGGVAKTTTVHSLGDAFVELGKNVLLVDLDPQACLTYAMGIDPEALESTMHDVFAGRVQTKDVVVELDSGPSLLPSSIDLAGAEVHLLTKTGREFVLARALKPLVGHYDYLLVDCGPSLGILTINGLTAADLVAIPFQCDTLSHRGVGQLLETVADVRAFTNDDLEILGGVATLFDGRTRLAHEVLAAVEEQYGLHVLPPPIPKSVRVAEAPGKGRSVLAHAKSSKPALAYRELASTIASKV
ncbi:MAG: AAA family ATPase [Acidimicrobiia bacterium]|nr:AAA family ATPase [Acidimicrobiia bacterium]